MRQEDQRTPLSQGPFTLQAVVPGREVWGASGPDERRYSLQAGPEEDRQTDTRMARVGGSGGVEKDGRLLKSQP